jgi:hypothetical protein
MAKRIKEEKREKVFRFARLKGQRRKKRKRDYPFLSINLV